MFIRRPIIALTTVTIAIPVAICSAMAVVVLVFSVLFVDLALASFASVMLALLLSSLQLWRHVIKSEPRQHLGVASQMLVVLAASCALAMAVLGALSSSLPVACFGLVWLLWLTFAGLHYAAIHAVV